MAKMRSPNYPAIGLHEAINRTKKPLGEREKNGGPRRSCGESHWV